MVPLDVVYLTAFMGRTSGQPEISIGLIDSPAALNLLAPPAANIHEVSPKAQGRSPISVGEETADGLP